MNASLRAQLSLRGRDLRLDLARGIANWFIFLDHIPHNVVNLLTLRNFGFSGATDVFVFVGGYGAAILYGKMMMERGFVVGATRILARVAQLYAAYIVLFVIYIDAISSVAAQYSATDIIDEYNLSGLVSDDPTQTLLSGLLLQTKPLHLDSLQLFIALLAIFPLALWCLLRRPHLTMAGSVALYGAARWFDWSIPSFPDGSWYFNPFCWQLLFVMGAWFALNRRGLMRAVTHTPWLRLAALAYLLIALEVTTVGQAGALNGLIPDFPLNPFAPADKENLALYRVIHLLALALVFTYWVPRDWSPLRSRALQPLIKCGEEWLPVFCIGVFLSFAGHFILITSPNSLALQILVSLAGLAIMTMVAYYISWSRQQDMDRKSGLRARA
jgi:hypothetical protein